MKRLITLCLLGGCFLSASAQNYVSQAWVADQGNGTYKNPVLYALLLQILLRHVNNVVFPTPFSPVIICTPSPGSLNSI